MIGGLRGRRPLGVDAVEKGVEEPREQ